MSGDLYTRLAASAQRQLENKGRPWTFTTTNTDGSKSARSAVGVFIETVRTELGNSGVAIGDRKYIFSSTAVPINGDSMVAANGERYIVKWSDQIGDSPVAYWVWGSKG